MEVVTSVIGPQLSQPPTSRSMARVEQQVSPLVRGQADLTCDDGGEHATRRDRAGEWRGCDGGKGDADGNHCRVGHGVTESEQRTGDVVRRLVVSTMAGPRVDSQPGDPPWAGMQYVAVQRPFDEWLGGNHGTEGNRILQTKPTEANAHDGG